MNNYFECAIKYEKTADEGKIVTVTEKYLVDALTFSEAEGRIIKEMKPFISGEFTVKSIKRFKIAELFLQGNGDKYFKAKVNFIVLDEDKGKEKKIASPMLISAFDLKEARENLVEGMKGTMADWEVESITETKIIEYYKFNN